jgi:hypothetical protein
MAKSSHTPFWHFALDGTAWGDSPTLGRHCPHFTLGSPYRQSQKSLLLFYFLFSRQCHRQGDPMRLWKKSPRM